MLANILLVLTSILLLYFFLKRKEGIILSFFVVFPSIFSFLLNESGIEGFSLFFRYAFFVLLILSSFKIWRHQKLLNFNSYFTSLLLLTSSMLLFNQFSSNGDNVEVAIFQQSFFLYVFFPVIVVLLVLRNQKAISEFIISIPYWGMLYALIFILFFELDRIDLMNRITFVETTGFDTIAASRIFGLSFIISIVSLFKPGKRIYQSFLFSVLVLFNIVFLLIVGQRGTILGVFFGMTVFVLYTVRKENIPYYVLIIMTIFSVFYFKIIDLTQFEVFQRFYHLKYYQEYERYADYANVWKIFKENWYFFGEGSWGYRFLTGRVYPHNIILECISDYGLIGFISILSIVTYSVYCSFKIMKNNDDAIGKVIVATWLVLLSSVFVSGNLNSNAIFFIYTSMLTAFYRINYSNNRSIVINKSQIHA